MTHHEFDLVDGSIIIQHIGGDLRLRGGPDDRLIIDGDAVWVDPLGEGKPFVIRAGGDARITTPESASVSVEAVGGDAKITGVNGQVDIRQVGGDLVVRSVGPVTIRQVGGDARIKRVAGDLTIDTVGGDATIRRVEGAVHVTRLGADLYLRQIEGSCVVEHVGSDIVLNMEFVPDQEYRFHVGDSLLCRVRPDADVTFILPSETEVHVEMDAEVVEEADHQRVVLGEGTAQVQVSGASLVHLIDVDEDMFSGFGFQLEAELEARLSSLEATLSQQLEGLDERIQQQAMRMASQAERMAERAEREALRAAERVRRSMARWSEKPKRKRPRKRKFMMGFDAHHPPAPDREPVSEQERLLILKMVQENKITVEEAERLLSALES